MKKTAFIALIMFFQLLCPDLPCAETTVKVGIYNNAPLISVGPEGKGKGFFADILEHIAAREDWQIVYVPGTWQRNLENLENRQIDILCAIAYSQERDRRFDFTEENLLTNWGQVYTPQDSSIKAITDLAGKKVAVLDGDIHFAAFNQIVGDFGINCDIVRTDDYHKVLQMVSRHEVDAGVINRFFGIKYGHQYNVDKSNVIFNPIKLHFAVPKGNNGGLIPVLDDHIRALKADEGSIYYHALEQWFGAVSPRRTMQPVVKATLVTIIGLALLLILANILLRFQVRSKTRALVAELDRRQQSESKLRKSEAKYRRLFERSTDAVFLVDKSTGRYLDANAAASALTGYTTAELKTQSTRNITPKGAKQRLKMLASSHDSTEWSEVIYIRKDGSHRIAKLSAVPLDDATVFGIAHDITEHKQAENALLENRRQLATLMSNLPGMAYRRKHDPDKSMLFISDGCLRLTGYESKAIRENLAIGYGKLIHPEDRHMVWKQVQGALEKKRPYQLTYRIRTAQGEEKWVWEHGQGVFGNDETLVALEGFIIDVTERKHAEEALRESEEKYRRIFKNSVVGLFQSTPEGKFINVNPAFAKMLHYESPEDLVSSVTDIARQYYADPEERCRYQQLLQQFGSVEDFEFRARRKDGTHIWVSNSTRAYFDKKGNLVQFEGIVMDITQRKKAEAENEALQSQLRQAQKLESIGILAGGIAHDFNNILAAMIGFTELALEDVAPGSQIEDHLQEIFTAGKRARDLVKQILAFARQSDEAVKPIQVAAIVKEVLGFIRSSIPTTINIRQRIDSHALIMGNATQVHQVLMNLCTNAAHAMEDRGGVLEVGLTDILADDERRKTLKLTKGEYIEIRVSDTGTGIPPEIINSIFDPYFTTKGPGEGTGMGLAVVHGIIRSYGGKISVDSKPGTGTLFSIYLPAARNHKKHTTDPTEALPTGSERILFVDDEAPIARIGSQILQRLGYKVETRTSSVEALALFRSKPSEFDLLITDMTMPNLTGDQLASEILHVRPDIPVIICTGYSKKLSDEAAAEIGIKGLAYKPIVKSDLAVTVRKVLDEARTTIGDS